MDSLVTSGTKSVAQIQTKGIGVSHLHIPRLSVMVVLALCSNIAVIQSSKASYRLVVCRLFSSFAYATSDMFAIHYLHTLTCVPSLNLLLCVQNIQKAQNRFEHKTKVAWNPWRPIVMAVLFGLLIIFAIVACCTAISRRFPRTTAAFTLLLWLMTAIFFILGSGKLIADNILDAGVEHWRQ